MRYHLITSPDIENGLGFRTTLWISGCSHRCKGCHNPETHDFLSGKPWTSESYQELREKLDKKYIKGLTLSGGDPLESAKDLLEVVKQVKQDFPDKDIWCYTGFTLEECQQNEDIMKVLDYVDVLVDGPFKIKQMNLAIPFRGSENQRIWEKDDNGNFILSKLN